MKLSDLVRALEGGGIEDAAREARLLFSHVTGTPPHRLIGDDPACDDPRLSDLLARRLSRIPLAYLVGEVGFYRETYRVTPDVLIPRPETELLVEKAIGMLPDHARFLDLCCGSGCVGISVLCNRPRVFCDAVDLSPEAVALTRENGERNGVSSRLSAALADLFALPAAFSGYDAVLSNPPYIARGVIPSLSPEVQTEPHIALDGGPDGLAFYREIIRRLPSLLVPSGFCLCEIGYDQGDAIKALAVKGGYSAEIFPDLAGLSRVALIRKP